MAKNVKRANTKRFAGVPHAVMENRNYIGLSFSARSLLFEIAKQYNGHNNGKLCAIPDQLISRGFKAANTVYSAAKELVNAELLVVSKVSPKGSRKPHYYALTWEAVDEIQKFNMDIDPTKTPLRKFSIDNGLKHAA
jgi:hypothetical protein